MPCSDTSVRCLQQDLSIKERTELSPDEVSIWQFCFALLSIKIFLDSWAPLCYPLNKKIYWVTESKFFKMLTLSCPVEFTIFFKAASFQSVLKPGQQRGGRQCVPRHPICSGRSLHQHFGSYQLHWELGTAGYCRDARSVWSLKNTQMTKIKFQL